MSGLEVLGVIFLIVLSIFIPRTIFAIVIGVMFQEDYWWTLSGVLCAFGIFIDCASMKKWFT
ncbi:MAG: hypothetical protein A3D35_02305 [Candidatus Staskawiczbacteria bacterium RIFCSPHIGHO2_02_FULL_34_9]|uniref:Uncharacterized protein n=1 Tax=Candidatus Staskawiczbacteria bacterium RIFCSPHIGHO2_02_FULL_34_9 TaxID=1802206 RepID=A0A1G2I294_9BACT|nr:MAG: hypothetical protein A3D35_02305 [Candidatus Staskawiczbacteria bacterium RIFCSPHIGHO2_02_FULL_34_9]